MKKKKLFISIIIIAIIIAIIGVFVCINSDESELKTIKSKKELLSIYEDDYDDDFKYTLLKLLFSPIALLSDVKYSQPIYNDIEFEGSLDATDSIIAENSTSSSLKGSSSSKEHSTTNIQVENVDEADITKTDGDYIYSISEDKVIITDVSDPTNIKIASRITPNDDYIPEDLLLYEDKLVVISSKYSTYYKSDTYVGIYDISIKEKPVFLKGYALFQKYYTSRCIDGKLLVIASGRLRKTDDEIDTYYIEDTKIGSLKKEIALSDIHYLTDVKSDDQTLVSSLDLNNIQDVKVNSYLFNVENAYISEENIYLLNEDYDYNNDVGDVIKNLFGLKGIIGFFQYMADYDYDYNEYTNIYKFKFLDDGEIQFSARNKVEGTTINQFSLDEYEENLRIGLYTTDGSRIVVLNDKLNVIGETEYLSKGEKMYSTRFVGNKAYMVTYKTIDPLYVFDLSDPKNPEVLGELKIPGYSTYLHPYDENHIIGIGMQTEERINRNSSGKIISTSAVITGMKMALFDVSDVSNPIEISQTIIGDSRTTSAILTNHKALLFSKEKGIIAIPVNNYSSDFEISNSSSDISSLINSYTRYSKEYISEGYLVYNINLEDGFDLKGTITHNKSTSIKKYYSYYNNSKLLRGMWIEDNLFTVSEDMIKVNKLDTLENICELNIKED